MASSRSSVIQFNDGQDAQSELQFQDFTLGDSNPEVATINPSGSYTNFTEVTGSPEDETDNLLGTEKPEEASFWKFSYYQSFFDVDTSEVLERLKGSVIPVTGRATYLDRCIRPKPDLYGPFWITTTLIYTVALGSNIANYLISIQHSNKTWTYDFHRVSLATTAIYAYAFLLPIALWGFMWYRKTASRCTLLEIICVYGYSLAVYIPVSLFWIGPDIPWLRYILLTVGAIFSGIVLLQTFWPILCDDNKRLAIVVISLILIFHVLLAVGFGAYFFQSAKWTSPASISNATVVTQSPVAIYEKIKVSRSAITDETTLQKLPVGMSDNTQTVLDDKSGAKSPGNSSETNASGKMKSVKKDLPMEMRYRENVIKEKNVSNPVKAK